MIECRNLSIAFDQTMALDDVSLRVAAGEVVAVTGPSGCGKSTLLHVMSGLLRPDAGEVLFQSQPLSSLPDVARSARRLRSFGFVLQFGDLVPELTLVENVELPLRLTGVAPRDARQRAKALMGEFGLDGVLDRHAAQVSGGQAQRAAVARALIHNRAVVFADEPTGALDSASGHRVLDTLVGAARQRGASVILVTHADAIAHHADRVIRMRDGRVLDPDPHATASGEVSVGAW